MTESVIPKRRGPRPGSRIDKKPWTQREIGLLRSVYNKPGWKPGRIAAALGRTYRSVLGAAKRAGLQKKKFFTAAEIQYIRSHPADSSVAVGRALGRSHSSILNQRFAMGITVKRRQFGPQFAAFLREKHSDGWSDHEIATVWKCDRHTVGDHRKKLGLSSNALSPHRVDLVRQRTREQCHKAGVKSLAEVRALAFKKYATKYGWPEDLLPRQVQMLNALMRMGPSTRRQIAEAIGMPWKGAKKSLTGNVPSGTYLYDLIQRGLIVNLGRIVKGKGSGFSTCLYSIPLWTKRNSDAQEHVAQAG